MSGSMFPKRPPVPGDDLCCGTTAPGRSQGEPASEAFWGAAKQGPAFGGTEAPEVGDAADDS